MANYTIGPKIGLDGEKEFRAQLNGINENLRTLDSELKKTASEFEDNADSQEALTRQNEILNKEIEQQEKKLTEVKKALEYSKKEYGDSATQTQKWQRVLNNTETDLNKLRSQVKKNETAINELDNASDKSEESLKKMGNSAEEAGQKGKSLSNISDNIKNQTLMEAGEQLQVISDKIIEIGQNATETFQEMESSSTKVNTYFGETGEAAEKNAEIIKNIYEEGVGDSMDSVADAVIKAKRAFSDLSDEDLTAITKQAMTLEDVFEIDMNETLRGAKSLMTQFRISAQEAMDYIVAGTQNGIDITSELGDNLSEYAGKFAQAGYSAEEYFQLLQNGMSGGAYTLDKVNDAINEITTKLAEEDFKDSIGIFSKKTQELFQLWKKGGTEQKNVIDSIITDIRNTTNEQKALNMASTAFGSIGEDSNLKMITSLTAVGDEYSNVEGKAQSMYDQSTTSAQEIEGYFRQLKDELEPVGETLTELLKEILPPLVDFVTQIVDGFGALPQPLQDFILVAGGITTVLIVLIPIILSLAGAIGTLEGTIFPVIAIIAVVVAAIAGIIAIIKNWGEITEWLGDVWEKIKEKFNEAIETIKSKFDEAGEKFNNKVKEIGEAIQNGFQTAVDFITSLPGKALQWGKDFIQGLIDGIKSMISNIGNAVKSVADKIASYLHFSVPDVGPLVSVPKWMPDMINEMTKGIYANEDKLKTAAGSLAGALSAGMSIDADVKNIGAGPSEITIISPTYLDGKIISNNTQTYITNQQAAYAMSKGKLNVRF